LQDNKNGNDNHVEINT